ncbi:MAG: hypothetical protein QOJ19_4991 [Acidimicrobiia bacterium]|nr:hypothetical protein [Acidimicrobiia bacterium]
MIDDHCYGNGVTAAIIGGLGDGSLAAASSSAHHSSTFFTATTVVHLSRHVAPSLTA